MRQVGEGDFFWDENGRSQFPKVAEEVDAQLQKYKQVFSHTILPNHFQGCVWLSATPDQDNMRRGCPVATRCLASWVLIPIDSGHALASGYWEISEGCGISGP